MRIYYKCIERSARDLLINSTAYTDEWWIFIDIKKNQQLSSYSVRDNNRLMFTMRIVIHTHIYSLYQLATLKIQCKQHRANQHFYRKGEREEGINDEQSIYRDSRANSRDWWPWMREAHDSCVYKRVSMLSSILDWYTPILGSQTNLFDYICKCSSRITRARTYTLHLHSCDENLWVFSYIYI